MSTGEYALLRWIPALPLLGVLVHGISIGVVRRALPPFAVWGISFPVAALSFALSLIAFFRLVELPDGDRVLVDTLYTWIGAGIGDSRLAVDLGFHLDPLAAVLLLLVTGISALVHLYAIAHMNNDVRDDRGYQRFFCYLNLLLAAMLILVLADNLVLLLVGWEGIALASYLLIGFWYSDDGNVRAGSRCFIANRIGDFGSLIGIFLLFTAFLEVDLPGSLLFSDMRTHWESLASVMLATPFGGFGGLPASLRLVDVLAFCFLLGVCAKLAQIPLAFWISGAALAPAPGQALIHSASLAPAGVYLVCRLCFLFESAPQALAVMSWVGAFTACFAAVLATAQLDLRKALVFIAMSQQGIVLLALGCGAFTAALFYLVANALVMALLFLGAGSVSRALNQETSITRMGDLGRRLVSTCWSFRVGAAVLVGFPLGSIFFSRGGVLAACLGSELPGRDWLFGMALGATLLVSFAISRLYLLIFSGESRVPGELRERVRESPGVMLAPLFALAALAAFAGLFGMPQFFADVTPMQVQSSHSLGNFLATTLPAMPMELTHTQQLWLTLVASLTGFAGFGIAYGVYVAKPVLALRIAESIPTLHRILQERLYLERAEAALVTKPLFWLVDRVLFRGIERFLLDGWLVEGSARLLRASAQSGLRYLHAGLAHGYLFFMIAGTAAVLGYLLH